MTGFLSGLGAFAGGLAPGVQKYADSQSTGDLGTALAQLYGGQQASPTGQQNAGPLGSIGSLFQNLFGGQGGAASAMPQLQQQAQPAITQPAAQTGARMPQPAIAQPGGGMPQQQQQQQPQAPPQPAPQEAQQQQPQPQPMHAQPQQQPQLGQGHLDIPSLVQALQARGVSGRRLGEAVTKAVPLLNAQGLQQYRELGLQLRNEHEDNLETDRRYNRDPDAAGSRASHRVNEEGIAARRMEGVQSRFKERMAAQLDKLKNARTDKEAVQAKQDLDKTTLSLREELKSELAIAMAPGSSAEEQKAAMQKSNEIREQIEEATDAAIKARRAGTPSGDQVGGGGDPKGGDSKSGQQKVPSAGGQVMYTPDGKAMRYKGTGNKSDPNSWEPADGGQ